MESGWDPEVKQYFRKIINTVSLGLSWLLAAATAGLYFRLAYRSDVPLVLNFLYYALLIGTGFLLGRYLYRLWR